MNKILCSLFTLCLALLASAPVRAGATLDALTDANQPIEVPALQVARWHTPAGTPVLFVRSQQLPMFDVQVIFAAGSAYEQGVAGLAQLTLGMLDEGTLVRDASAFAEALDDTGAVLHKSSGRERVQVASCAAQP
ncbi:hypothetical protein [Pseudomonas aegrilactucae]|uniref:Insulinase family protein n=1 Tax=Pseudomonas aegrilactucae TaxID=2854028 RepID=A0A9Q2XMU5_9PSED|nr:hypothetical protein [Pseudomonas aegrilactucae]MBV6289122.1 hypothetical protein [Pseudomonas aegrilactucae]